MTQEVIVEALDKIEVEYTIDGGATTKVLLSPEQVYAFKATKNIKLRISDGGAVNLFYNGSDRGVPGDLGKPVNLSYP